MSDSRPDRDDYPDPSLHDLARAVRETYEQEDNRTRVRGRYTAKWTYLDIHDGRVSSPGPAREKVILVQACEREYIAIIPWDGVPEYLDALDQPDGDGPDVMFDHSNRRPDNLDKPDWRKELEEGADDVE